MHTYYIEDDPHGHSFLVYREDGTLVNEAPITCSRCGADLAECECDRPEPEWHSALAQAQAMVLNQLLHENVGRGLDYILNLLHEALSQKPSRPHLDRLALTLEMESQNVDWEQPKLEVDKESAA